MVERLLAAAVILAGTALYAALAFGLFLGEGIALVGDKLYDYYFLALAEGRFDVPPRIATLEGHYDAEGRAYVYHGIAPMLTRLAAAPFIDLRETQIMASLSVWLFASLGALAYHLALVRLVAEHAEAGRARLLWMAIVGVMAWVCAPGLLLAANHSMFHEPTAVAFFCTGWSVYLYLRVIHGGARPASAFVLLALLAGLCVFARPNVAAALYLGLGLAMLAHLLRTRLQALGPVIAATVVLGIAGAGFLGFNAARFGDPLQMFGSNEDGAALEYGFSYWGFESPQNDRRLAAFVEHGTFNAGRIGPNLMLYAVDLPWGQIVGQPRETDIGPINAVYRDWTLDRLGYIRVEAPQIGFVYIWAPWLLLALLGVLRPPAGAFGAGAAEPVPVRGGYGRGAFAIAGLGVMALLILSYGTVTLRYRFEVFPLIAILGALALPRLLAWQAARPGGAPVLTGLMALAIAGAAVLSLGVAVMYADNFPQMEVVSAWSFETCERLVLEKGFAADEVDRLCRL